MRKDFLDRVVALRPELCRQAARFIGKQTQLGTPEDFVQDTIVTALQTAHQYEDDNLAGWLVTILDHHIRNARRRVRVRTSVPLMRPASAANGNEAGEVMIELPVAATQDLTIELEDVLAVLQTLSPADQEVIRLYRIEGLPHEEIAERLGVAPGTVHSRLSRATARLRAACEATPGVPEEPLPPAYGRAA